MPKVPASTGHYTYVPHQDRPDLSSRWTWISSPKDAAWTKSEFRNLEDSQTWTIL
jgi:hypothetical protein